MTGCGSASSARRAGRRPDVRRNGAAARDVDVEVDRDDVAGAESPADRDRNGIDERAIEEPAAVDLDGAEDAGKRVGRADGLDEISARQPHFVAGADLGRDGREPPVEILDLAVAEMLLEALAETLPGDEAGAGQIEIEIAEDAPARRARARSPRARRDDRRHSSRRRRRRWTSRR